MRSYVSEPAPEGTPRTWDEWTDVLGQVYRAGDHVAVATISGKSPQMVLGRVERINRVDSKGSLIEDGRWELDGRGERKWLTVPSCTVSVKPLLDARGFTRWGNAKTVTYQFWQNIVKIDNDAFNTRVAALESDLADLLEELK